MLDEGGRAGRGALELGLTCEKSSSLSASRSRAFAAMASAPPASAGWAGPRPPSSRTTLRPGCSRIRAVWLRAAASPTGTRT